MTPRCFYLVVTRGPDTGGRLLVDAKTRAVGRSRQADLPLTDRGISRQHLEVEAVEDGVRVRVVEGAGPVVVGGRAAREEVVPPGEVIVLANTLLSVIEAKAAPPHVGDDSQTTDFRALLGGVASEVRGLAGIFELVEALDGARSASEIEPLVGEWGRAHVEATEVRVITPEGLDAYPHLAALRERSNDLIERRLDDDATELIVAAHATLPGALAFHLPHPPRAIRDATRRLLAVAGRVCASSLARVASLESVEQDHASLRRLAVGSARTFLGTSPAALQVERLVPRLAAADTSVLILGESGSGKTFVARLLHEAGPRARGPLRVLNCAAIPENLLEAELFGHERGAFTGAVGARVGAFEAAAHGTLLLDEIGELPLVSQAKLLRVIEERRFERLGSNRAIPLTARVLAATNRDLQQMVSQGTFRADLFFRISVVHVRIPALRERGDDVVLLADRLLADLQSAAGRRVRGFAPRALDVIRSYPWPGNVRELRNAIEHALVLGEGPLIEPTDLPPSISVTIAGAEPVEAAGDTVKLPAKLEWLEERAIAAALRATGGNRTRAAALLGINRVTLYKKLREET